MKKMWLALMLLFFALIAVGCNSNDADASEGEETSNGSSEEVDSSEEKQTVTFWHAMGGAAQEALTKL